jgi:tRNA A37 threonylcarbamoyltransferase TsaD
MRAECFLWVLSLCVMLGRLSCSYRQASFFRGPGRTQKVSLSVAKSSTDGFGKPKGYSDKYLRYVLEQGAKSGLPDISKPFVVLGIESSCDDTGVSIVRSDGTVLSNVVISQNDIHEKFGGIVPTLAMEQHKINIDVAIDQAVEKAGLTTLSGVDAIAVTKGPGLEICLRVGLRRAQEIAKTHNKPFVTVHHLEAHCIIARLSGQTLPYQKLVDEPPFCGSECVPKVEFPFLAVLASGGHTSILLCRELGDYTMLGGTLDDALGEAFDKASRLLGLRGASSGGVAIEQAAAAYKATLPLDLQPPRRKSALDRSGLVVPMKEKQNCDFSYAGMCARTLFPTTNLPNSNVCSRAHHLFRVEDTVSRGRAAGQRGSGPQHQQPGGQQCSLPRRGRGASPGGEFDCF